jgi:dihydrofolate reductase
MGKVIAGLFISLDGVVEAPDQWHFPYFDDEMGAAVSATLGAADTMLFGRVTYDSFAGAWPARESAGEEDAGFAKTPSRCATASGCSTRVSPRSRCGWSRRRRSPPAC